MIESTYKKSHPCTLYCRDDLTYLMGRMSLPTFCVLLQECNQHACSDCRTDNTRDVS